MDLDIDIDKNNNIVYMEHNGTVESIEEGEEIAERIRQVAEKLDPGWININDIRNMDPVNPEVSEIIDNVQEEIDKTDPMAVIRVVEESSIPQMSFRVGGDFDYKQYEAESLEEAEEIVKKIRDS